ncbi:MAG: metalloregulator ArsR/SmtB family transcription factor [Planctomycetes bacterium]|nr:metalloregulator ArsR/SmtB family transcription factor [Planctomycetota bacterium]
MNQAAAQPQALLGWMESLADSTRLRLLRLLERQELGVVELCEVLQMPQSTVSRHLKLLGDRGWTTNRREGTNNLYRMTLDELKPAARKYWVLTRDQTADWPVVEQDRLRLDRVLRDRDRDAQSFFADAAAEWDAIRGSLYGNAFQQSALLALLPPHWVVADLGCGTGAVAAELARHVARVIGVDQSPAMLKAARKRTHGLSNVDLRKGSLGKLPIDDASCDAVLIVLVLTYVESVEAALREAARVLKPGGRLVVVDLLRHDREDFRRRMGQSSLGFEPSRFSAMLTAAGLTPRRCEPLATEPQAKGPALMLAVASRTPSTDSTNPLSDRVDQKESPVSSR